MKRLLTLLLIIICFLLSAWIAWQVATEEQRRELLVFLGVERQSGKPGAADANDGARLEKAPVSRLRSGFAPRRQVFRHPQIAACGPRKPTNTARLSTKAIYRWKDDNGQTHFSDRPPENRQAQRVSPQPDLADSFDLRVRFDGVREWPDFSDQVRTGSDWIYRFFRDHLQQGSLPALNIGLVIAARGKRFEALKVALAPRLKTVGGFYDYATNQAVVSHSGKHKARTIAVSRHEIAHLITGNIYGDLDTWLSEGLAELFERMETHAQQTRALVRPADLKLLRQTLRQNGLPDLQTLMSTSIRQWYEADVHLMYTYAWSMVHFLVDREDARSVLRDLLKAQKLRRCQPFSSTVFLQENYPGGMSALERDWRLWLLDKTDKTLYY